MGALRTGFSHRRAPLIMLILICGLATGARVWHLGTPSARTQNGGYVFDEHYYVAAARVIAGQPAGHDSLYAGTVPAGADPNGEHPQLGKLVIAAGIDLLGDNASAWRITAVVFGLAALLLLYWLVRCAGGGPWLALGAVALASTDNLWLVSSRIAVLDIYVVPFLLAGVAFYLRRQPLVAGAVIGIGCCVKEFGLYALFVVLALEVIELAQTARGRPGGAALLSATRRAAGRWIACAAVTVLAFITLLSALDAIATPYSGGHPVDRGQAGFCHDLLIWRDGCNHFVFMSRYASRLRGEGGHKSIAAAPTRFWLDQRKITYYASGPVITVNGHRHTHYHVKYRGLINRVLLFTAWLALALSLYWVIRTRDMPSALALAWALGTWLPPELSFLLSDRTTYLYYMVVTMPAIYIAVARMFAARRLPWWLIPPWAVALLVDFVTLYPLRTLSGH